MSNKYDEVLKALGVEMRDATEEEQRKALEEEMLRRGYKAVPRGDGSVEFVEDDTKLKILTTEHLPQNFISEHIHQLAYGDRLKDHLLKMTPLPPGLIRLPSMCHDTVSVLVPKGKEKEAIDWMMTSLPLNPEVSEDALFEAGIQPIIPDDWVNEWNEPNEGSK